MKHFTILNKNVKRNFLIIKVYLKLLLFKVKMNFYDYMSKEKFISNYSTFSCLNIINLLSLFIMKLSKILKRTQNNLIKFYIATI